MTKRPGVGVIGLGRRWNRYRPALAEADSLVAVRAVWDPLAQRAARVAREFSCEAADGVEDLLDHPDLDALLLFDPPWHGLWPLERAARVEKPIFFAAPLTCDEGHADELVRVLLERPHPTMAALPTDFLPVTARLRVLLDKHLGAARSVSCLVRIRRQVAGGALLDSAALLPALHLCRELLGDSPDTVWTAAPTGGDMVNLTFAFPGGRAALVSLSSGRARCWRVTVTAERGTAEASLPRKLRWQDNAGEHALRLPPVSTSKDVLRRFAEAVVTGQRPRPGLAEALEGLVWLRAARRSHAENRPVKVAGD